MILQDGCLVGVVVAQVFGVGGGGRAGRVLVAWERERWRERLNPHNLAHEPSL